MLDLAEFANDPSIARSVLTERLGRVSGPSERAQIHYRLWEMCQVCGDPAAALRHLDEAMQLDPMQRPDSVSSDARRRIVVMNAPGTFQANAPLAFLLDDTTQIFTLWVSGASAARGVLVAAVRAVQAECVFIAIAEDERQAQAIAEAEIIAHEAGLPVLNGNDRIMQVGRARVPQLLAGIADVLVPQCTVIRSFDDKIPSFPVLIRPLASHAGDGLARIDTKAELETYIRSVSPGTSFYVTQFVDFISSDSLYRKYRVVFVEGEPFPVHLAIHDDWAIWYYNAKMENFPQRRAEEARFMTDMAGYFPSGVLEGLKAIARAVQLDYFGLDFGVLPDGTLVVFEVETGMIVHDRDPADIYPYKSAAIARIRHAVEAMIDQKSHAPS